MSSRETVIELVNKLPEEMPLAEIAREPAVSEFVTSKPGINTLQG